MVKFTQQQAFLQHITEHPDDLVTRLVYADWLDENGDIERAEFIRVQCALATEQLGCDRFMYACGEFCTLEGLEMLGCDRCQRYSVLKQREMKLLPTFEKGIHNRYQNQLQPKRWSFLFRRGFVEELFIHWQDWVKHHKLLIAELPLRKVNFQVAPPLSHYPHNDGWVFYWQGFQQVSTLWRGWTSNVLNIPDNNINQRLLRAYWPTIDFSFP